MTTMKVGGSVRSASIRAVKILADGTRVDLGVLCSYERAQKKGLLSRVSEFFNQVNEALKGAMKWPR